MRLGRFLAPYILLAVFKADTKPFVGLMSSVLKKRENQRAFVAHVKSAIALSRKDFAIGVTKFFLIINIFG